MAARMDQNAYCVKEKWLQQLEHDFILKLQQFTSDVKTSMQNTSMQSANQIFDLALDVLTRDFPDPKTMKTESVDLADEISVLKNEVNKLKTSQTKVMEKLTSVKLRSDKMNEKIEAAQKNVSGLRTLQKIFKAKIKNAVSTTPAQTPPKVTPVVSTTPLSTQPKVRPVVPSSTAKATKGSLKSISERKSFIAGYEGETSEPDLEEVILLPNKRILVADRSNKSVKMFDIMGNHIYRHDLGYRPYHMTVIETDTINTWKAAVTCLKSDTITILEVNPEYIIKVKSISMSRECSKVAGVNKSTLAVSYYGVDMVDLIDLQGRFLRQLSPSLNPFYMATTPDGFLLATTGKNLAKVRVKDGAVLFDEKDFKIEQKRGVAGLQHGWSVVVDSRTSSLHLYTPDGRYDRELWRHPNNEPGMQCVSVCRNVCVTSYRGGELTVLDLE